MNQPYKAPAVYDALEGTVMTTEAERAERLAYLRAEYEKCRPDGDEAEIVQLCRPGAVAFADCAYLGVSNSIDEVWPHAERWLQCMLDLWPVRWRLDYWRERMDRGASIMTVFFDTQAARCNGAGFVNPELDEDGKVYVFAPVMTLGNFDLSDLARIAESVALRTEAEYVQLWTPQPVPLVDGYQLRGCVFGQLQAAPVRPIQ